MYSRGKIVIKLINSLEQLTDVTKVGDILISAERKDAYNGSSFASTLRNFRQRVLQKLINKGVSIVTRSDNSRLHCHIAAEMPSQCNTFDWISFDQAETYYKLYKKYGSRKDLEFYRYFTKKYRASLPDDWRIINNQLMKTGKKYGLGRVFLTPIRKNMTAYKWYLVSNIPVRRDIRDKSIKYFSSWGMQNINGFQVINKFTNEYRRKLKKFGLGLQLTSESYNLVLRNVLGTRWYHRIKDLIRDIDKLSTSQVIIYNELYRNIQTHILRSQ